MLSAYLTMLETEEDRELFGVIYQAYYNKMMKVALKLLSSPPRAEDAVHDAFLKIIAHFDDLKAVPEERRWCWVLVVTKNAALDLLRKERREMPLEHEKEQYIPADEGDFRALVECIQTMPESYRRVLELRFVTEWSYAEIAQELHLSEGAVKTRISRGRQILIGRLEKEGFAYE